MKESKVQLKTDSQASTWQSVNQYANLVRNTSSGNYYARFRVGGKLIWKSLKTKAVTVAAMRANDLIKETRTNAASGDLETKSSPTFADAIAAYRQNGFRPIEPRTKKDAKQLKPAALCYYEERIAGLLKSWPGLDKIEVRKATERDCTKWAARCRKEASATVFNHTLGILRNLFEFGINAGCRYDNPARKIMRESEKGKTLELPSADQFAAFVKEIEQSGSRHSKPCAELVQFFAYSGFRKGEAAYITWADCDMERGQITARGHPETGLKNRIAGETRIVPMIPNMRQLLERMRSARQEEPSNALVMRVRECQKAMDRAAKKIGMTRITHHDLRHLFATRCIESGVDIPTVARWMGHKDGGALAMRVYGHLRDQHSAEMAQKVSFSTSVPPAAKLTQ